MASTGYKFEARSLLVSCNHRPVIIHPGKEKSVLYWDWEIDNSAMGKNGNLCCFSLLLLLLFAGLASGDHQVLFQVRISI
jgi:hypothetical protein